MKRKKMRFEFPVLVVSALLVSPLGADEIASHIESEAPKTLSASDTSAEIRFQTAKEHTDNHHGLEPYTPPAPIRPTPEIRRTKVLATRSPNSGYPVVTLLVPEHVALTVKEKPTLYWHLSEAAEKPVVLTIVDPDASEPLLEEQFESPLLPGIHSLKLSDYEIHLRLNKLYEWSVRIAEDPNDPSGDAVAKSFIKHVEPNAEVRAIVQNSDPLNRAQAYARNGIWYDALAAVSEHVPSASTQIKLYYERNSLLKQVALKEIVASTSPAGYQLGSNIKPPGHFREAVLLEF